MKILLMLSLGGMFIICGFGAWRFVSYDGTSPPEPFFYVLIVAAIVAGMLAMALAESTIDHRDKK